MIAETDVETISDTVSSIRAEHPVVVRSLFGSQALGDAPEGSGIDIAVGVESAESDATDTDMDTDVDMDTDSAQWDRPLQLVTNLALTPGTDDIDGRTVV